MIAKSMKMQPFAQVASKPETTLGTGSPSNKRRGTATVDLLVF